MSDVAYQTESLGVVSQATPEPRHAVKCCGVHYG
jgi:hypothetical protein